MLTLFAFLCALATEPEAPPSDPPPAETEEDSCEGCVDSPVLIAPPAPERGPMGPAPAAEKRLRKYKVGGIILPTLNFNKLDGFGLGVGAEIFLREREEEEGFKYRFTASTFWTVTGNYGSTLLNIEHLGKTHWFARPWYRLWKNYYYTGAGGADVITVKPNEAGNRMLGPSVHLSISRQIKNLPLYIWGQLYYRYADVTPAEGSVLEERNPLGVGKSHYLDGTIGLALRSIDRFPMPSRGVMGTIDVRGGATFDENGSHPLVGVHTKWVGYAPVSKKWFTLGARVLFDKTFGPRPFYEQEFTGGMKRDEVGMEQAFMGYGRMRTGGDGALAFMIEARPFFGRVKKGWADMAFYLSVFGEEGFLFDGNKLGPHLPTVGGGPVFLWQQAVMLRIWVAAGWTNTPTDPTRRAVPQFGLALVEPF